MPTAKHHLIAEVEVFDSDSQTGLAHLLTPNNEAYYPLSEANRIVVKTHDDTQLLIPPGYDGCLKLGDKIGITRTGWAPLHEVLYLQVLYCGDFYRVRRARDGDTLCVLARVENNFHPIRGELPRLQYKQLPEVTIDHSTDFRFPAASTHTAQHLFREIWSQVLSAPAYVKLPLRLTVD